MPTTIIDKTKPLPPKYTYKPPPTFKTSSDERKYWDKEKKKWIEGSNGLVGRHYAYLNIGSLKTIRGTTILPWWRDVDDMIFNDDNNARNNKKDTMVVKRREVGLTSIFGGFEPIYNTIIHPGSTSLMTSADAPRMEAMFHEKTMVMQNGLPKMIRSPQISERTKGYLHLGKKSGGEIVGIDSKVICKATDHNDEAAKGFETFRAMYIFLDELFLHKRADIVHASSQATLAEGFVKEGHLVLGGSCGATTPKEQESLKIGSALGEELWNNADALGIQRIFVAGWMGINRASELDKNGNATGKILNFCPNGHSDEKRATEWILRTRDKLAKADNKKFYWNFIKQYPLTIEEVFEVNRVKIFDEEVEEKINQSRIYIRKKVRPITQYSLFRNPGSGEITAQANKKGKFHILEHPRKDDVYIAGQDPIPFGSKDISKGSDHAEIIYGRMTNEPKAYYAERSLDADIVIDNCILLQEYYKSFRHPHGAPAMVEANRAEVTERVYRDMRKTALLSGRPRHLGIEYNDKKGYKIGWYSNDKTIARANDLLIRWLKQYGEKNAFHRLLKDLEKFPDGNTDLLDAMISALILDEELAKIEVAKYKKRRYRQVPYVTMDKHGRTQRKWHKVEVTN